MRVALVCDWFLPRSGGIEFHLRDLALALRAGGVDAHVVTTTRGEPLVDGVPVHRIDAPLAPVSGFALTPSFLAGLRTVLRDERFDVVHAHASVISPVAYGGAIVGARLGLPTVLTFHSMLHTSAIVLGASDALLGWSRNIMLTAVSSVVAKQAVRWMPQANVGILPNAVDAHFWEAPRRRGTSGEIHVVSAMRLSRKKRPLVLVRAFARAAHMTTDAPILRLTLAGDGPDRDSILRLAAELGIRDRVTLTGQLGRDELRTLYAQADVFVSPSERESFGLAALEARTAGLPVIGMAASGVRDFIAPGINGLLARDEVELGQFIARLALDDPLRQFIAHRNSVDAPAYDWASAIRGHHEIYRAAATLCVAPDRASHQ